MKKNQLVTTKSTSLILGKSKSLMGITKKLLQNKAVDKMKNNQKFTPCKEITIIGDLMWAKEIDKEMNLDDAREYAKNLELGEYDDWVLEWRLATKKEYMDVMILCGKEEVGYDDEATCKKNIENISYQSCYKKKGFLSHDYLASDYYRYFPTFEDYPEVYTQVVNFSTGLCSKHPTDRDSTNIYGHFRCVCNAAYKREIYEKLYELRNAIASKKGIPPYIIFSGKTLKELLYKAPQSKEEMLEVIGEVKFERYGEAFLEVFQ